MKRDLANAMTPRVDSQTLNLDDWTGDHMILSPRGGYTSEFPNTDTLFGNLFTNP